MRFFGFHSPAVAVLCAAALMLLWSGCGLLGGLDLDPQSQEFYDYARLIMTREESDIFHHLPTPESRLEFIADFWDKRDPDPLSQENEFQQEFYQRIREANRFFRSEGIPGWKTDRGRIYIFLGQPDKIEQRPYMRDPEIKGLIWWGYFQYKFGIWFADRRGDGQYLIYEYSSAMGESLYQVLQRVQRDEIRKRGEDFGNRYVDFDVGYDLGDSLFRLSIPVEDMVFLDRDGYLRAELQFTFYIYRRRINWTHKFQESRLFEMPQREVLQLEAMEFLFPLSLPSGDYYVDVVLTGEKGVGKTRKIFRVKVF
jgi:GWxTD domain-containing protein